MITDQPSITHEYTAAGHYNVLLVVKDEAGLRSSAVSHVITILSPEQNASSVDIVLILDCSGSMSSNDPTGLRKQAAKLLIQQARIGDRIGVVGFTSSAQVFANLTLIGSQQDKDNLQLAVDRAFASGGTNLGAGLTSGYQVLSQDMGMLARRAAVFLTDGLGSYNNEAEAYAGKGWRVYTVGLSNQHDANLLQKIASDTGGRYFNSPTNAELQTIYADLSGRLTGRTTLFQEILNATQGAIERIVRVIPGVPNLTVNLYWPGNLVAASSIDAIDADVRLRLIDPDGILVDPTYPSIEYQRGTTYESYSLVDPKPGEWTFEIEIVSAQTPLEVTLEVKAQDITPPTGTLAPLSAILNTPSTEISLLASDEDGTNSELEYRTSRDNLNWSEWRPYVQTIPWAFQESAEVQYVCAQYRDTAGNVSPATCANFIIDLVAPETFLVGGQAIGFPNAPLVLNWYAEDDMVEGDAGYSYSYILDGHDSTWSDYQREKQSVTYENLFPGEYTFMVRARDYAGNIDPTPAAIPVSISAPTALDESQEPSVLRLWIPHVAK